MDAFGTGIVVDAADYLHPINTFGKRKSQKIRNVIDRQNDCCQRRGGKC